MPDEIVIRAARTSDIRTIREIVRPHADSRVLVSKDAVTYYEALQQFKVAEQGGGVVGCGALHVMWEDLAEIRTLAVRPEAKGHGVGSRLLEALMADARDLGVQLDGYLITGFKGFRAMINAMGGLRYVAPAVFKGEHGILAKKGLNILRGEPALSFARERHTLKNGDFGRSQNQGKLIIAGMSMARAGGHKGLLKYLGAMSPHVETDLSPAQVLNLGASVFRASPKTVKNVVVPGGVGTRSGQSVVVLGGAALSIFRDIRNGRLGA